MGEVNLPPGGRRFGRKEEKKKGRKEEGKKEWKEDQKKGEVVYTLVPVGRRIICSKNMTFSFENTTFTKKVN